MSETGLTIEQVNRPLAASAAEDSVLGMCIYKILEMGQEDDEEYDGEDEKGQERWVGH